MPTIKTILTSLNVLDFRGDLNAEVNYPIPFNENNLDPKAIMWSNDKNLSKVGCLSHGTLICSSAIDFTLAESVNIIICEKPRDNFRILLENFFYKKRKISIANTAVIHSSVKVGLNVFIGENVIIEEDCVIGNDTQINHNTCILKGSILHDKVIIGCNCTIGGDGFGYEKDIDGKYNFIPHLGNVIINQGVHIGNNTCIDRAVLGSTVIKENVKIDNLVQIAHGVSIGRNSLIIANAFVGGSTVIGESVWVAPSASILNKLTIGDYSIIGIGATALRNVDPEEVIMGNPGRAIK
jgi:UDP-3-O-[3-hydroxymyristoyl] glucosamine N-acyltransferase